MAYADLRKFIKRLRSEGELAEVSAEVDWGYEIGGIVRKTSISMDLPSCLEKSEIPLPPSFRAPFRPIPEFLWR